MNHRQEHRGDNSPSADAHAGIYGVPPQLFWLNTVISTVAIVFSIFAICSSWWQAKEFKQVQVQLMYANAIMLREGLVQPGDMVYGPEGNLEYKQHQLKPKEK